MPLVRRLRPDHPDALALIAGSEAESAGLYPPEERFAFSPRELLEAEAIMLVAFVDDAPAACGAVAPLAEARPAYGELKRVYCRPEARGKGVAARLIAALEDEARALGLNLMRLETGVRSPAALRFYERLGYQRCGPFGGYEENGSSVFMEKSL